MCCRCYASIYIYLMSKISMKAMLMQYIICAFSIFRSRVLCFYVFKSYWILRLVGLHFNNCTFIFVPIWAALNETLTAEVQRLRLTVKELGGESIIAGCMARQRAINQQRFQVQHEQPSQLKPQKETQTQARQIQHNEMHLQPQNDKATAYWVMHQIIQSNRYLAALHLN